MKSVRKYYRLALVFVFFSLTAAGQTSSPVEDRAILTAFEKRVGEYSASRERLEGKLPKLPKKATPEQIEAHRTALIKSIQAERTSAKQGDIFIPEASRVIRTVIKAQFDGPDRAELRKHVFEADTAGVVAKVNVHYPESKELVDMPPALLLVLPQLPKHLRYRFVGTNMLLVDKDSNVIIDYMTNALP